MALSVSNCSLFSNIHEINSDKSTWHFKAKIIRLWQVSDFNRSNVPFSIEMVLMDADGGRIHATIKKTLIYKFKDELIEGKIYSFENLGVAVNGGAYRTTRHPYKLNFQFGTVVQRLCGLEINKSPFDFIPISDIVSGNYDTDFLCDVIGLLTGVGQEREITNQNGSTTKLNVIEMEKDGHKLQCTLFGTYVDELNTFLGAGETNNAVVIIQFAKAKNFQDKIHIQNCMNCSVLIFNSKCAESVAFRSSLAETVENPSPMTLTQLNMESRVSPIEEFLYNTPIITLQSLRDAASGSSHVVAATVKRILNPEAFWYTACVCNKAVVLDSGMWYCEKCNKHVVRVFHRFCIKVRVMDHTDSATFVIFDKDANLLFDMSCADMVHEMETAGTVGLTPPQLEGVIDKTWLFKVESKTRQNPNFEQSFRVRKICTDAEIIHQFKSKWDKEEAVVGKIQNECGSLSALVDNGKGALIVGSSDLLSQDYSNLDGSDVKGKGIALEGTPDGVSQDLMHKFSTAVVHLDCDDPIPIIGSSKSVSSESQQTSQSVANNEDKYDENIEKKHVVNLEEKYVGRATGQRKKSVAKRVSPTLKENDEDENTPMKLLKRAVKIEKIP